jgi:transposase
VAAPDAVIFLAAQGGAAMAKPILDDELWKMIEPLLPPPKKRRNRFPRRKPIDNRSALSAILFVLKTSLP